MREQVNDTIDSRYSAYLEQYLSQQHLRHGKRLLQEFQETLASTKSVSEATGEQVAKFLLRKDTTGNGRTVVHGTHCPFLGAHDNDR